MNTDKSLIILLFLLICVSVSNGYAQNLNQGQDSLLKNAIKGQGGDKSLNKGVNVIKGNTESTEPTKIEQPERVTQKSDYKDYKTQPSSDVFGAEFFNSASLSFEPNLRIATPPNYVLGPDDELSVNVSGYQETNIITVVKPEGTVFIPQVGSINVLGLTVEEATARIKSRLGQTAYPSIRSGQSTLIISLNKIRSIRVTVVGAVKPGNYTVSSLSTVYNSLSQSGGPGKVNSYREIELLRNNKVYQKIDLYQFLTRGNQQGNVLLRDNDVINFPVYKKHVTITGAVKRAGTFELKDNETLDDLLFFAGGYTELAYKATIKVKQNTDVERRVKDILKADIASFKPANGDEFKVDSILERVENAVTINGAVYRPGEFELTPNITVSGLIKRAGGLLEDVVTERANLTRTYANGKKENFTFNVADILNGGAADMLLVKKDEIEIFSASDFLTNYQIQVLGEVRKPGELQYRQNLTLKDAVFLAGGLTDASSAYHVEVGRRITADRVDKKIDSIAKVYELTVNKGYAIEDDKFVLQPFDIINIRRNPGYIEQQSVTINGEVNYPGNYTIKSKTERISDLIKRAGGLTPVAYDRGIFLMRNNIVNDNESQQAAANIQKNLTDSSTKVIEDISKTNIKIAVNFQKIMKTPGSVEDYVLQANDVVTVTKLDPLVKLSGEVLTTTKTGYVAGKSMRYYLSQAGGTNERARRSKIYILYANGRIKRTWNGIAGIFRTYPKIEEGSEVIVPRKVDGKKLSTTEIVGITSGIASLVTLIIVTVSALNR